MLLIGLILIIVSGCQEKQYLAEENLAVDETQQELPIEETATEEIDDIEAEIEELDTQLEEELDQLAKDLEEI